MISPIISEDSIASEDLTIVSEEVFITSEEFLLS